jgi:putative peptidoglycan lipid II flippase
MRAEAQGMSLAHDITTVGSGTLISRPFARDAVIAAWLGAGPFSEAFFAMLQVINFFRRLLAEGALNGAFVPIWLTLRSAEDGEANANRFTWRSLLAMLCVTGVIALAVIVLAPLVVRVIAPGFDTDRRAITAFLLLIAAPYILLAGLVAVLAAALNAEGRVGAVTVSTVIFYVVMVAAAALAAGTGILKFEFTLVITGAIVLAGLVQLLIARATWLMTGERRRRARIRAPNQTRTLFVRAGPGLIAAGIPQLKLIAAAAIVSASPAALSWLYYANRLYELPLGVASIAIAAVIVPRIAASLRNSEADAFAATQSRAYEIALGLALPAATGFAVLAQPIAGGLFQRGAFGAQDMVAVAAALTAICAGLPGHVLEKVFGAVSFAHDDTHTPMIAACCGLATAVAGGLLLLPHYGYVGVAAAIAISGWVGAGVLGLILYRRRWLRLDRDARRRLPPIVLATAVMGAVVAYGSAAGHRLLPAAAVSSPGRIAVLLILVAFGLAIYAGALHLLGVATLKDLMAGLKARA